MNKCLKYIILFVILITTTFIMTGCGKEPIHITSSKFKVDQVSDKNIKVTLEDAKKNGVQTAKLSITEGEEIVTITDMEEDSAVFVYYFKAGSKHDRDSADYDLLNGNGKSSTTDFPEGEYELEFVIESNSATGSIDIQVK